MASSSPDCVIVNEYSTSSSSSPDSEASSRSGVDINGKTVSSFHVPKPPEDVSILFMDEVDEYQEGSGVEQGQMKDHQLGMKVEQMRRSMAGLKFTDPQSSPVLHSPDDIRHKGRNEEEGSPSCEETKSDSFSSLSSKASPTLPYSCSSGEEGESERSTSLAKTKTDRDSSVSNEEFPTVLYPVGGKEGERDGSTSLGKGKPDCFLSFSDKEGKERSTSLGKVSNDSSPSLSSEASSPRLSSEGGKDHTLLSSASQCLATCSSGEEQESNKSSPPVHALNQSGHSSETGQEGDPENSAGGSGGSIGMAKGNNSEAGAAGKEQEKERKEEEEEEEERSAKPEPQFKVGYQYRTVERQLMQNEVSHTHNLLCKLQLGDVSRKISHYLTALEV